MNAQQPLNDSLSLEKMQLFAATLANLPPEEIRKAKLLYIRNAVSEFRAMEKSVAGFRQLQGCMSIIPVFWPVLALQKKMINAQVELARERIMNAVDVWKDDLKAAGFDVTRLNLLDENDPENLDNRRF